MSSELPAEEFDRFWRRLRGVGLTAYEARAYLVMVGHPRFKALELATRASVPRQKIYEVLDSLVEKGFAQISQERTKLFSAVEPGLAVPGYMGRRREALERELAERARLAAAVVDDLNAAYSAGQNGKGTLDFLRIVSDPVQAAARFREMLAEAGREYLEFIRPPYATTPLEWDLIASAARRGVSCRILAEAAFPEAAVDGHGERAGLAGVEVRVAARLPMKMAVFDGSRGLIALLDPGVTRPAWTSVLFDHPGMGQAMRGLFEDHWRRATSSVARQAPAAAHLSGG